MYAGNHAVGSKWVLTSVTVKLDIEPTVVLLSTRADQDTSNQGHNTNGGDPAGEDGTRYEKENLLFDINEALG